MREVARRHDGTFESGQVDGVYRVRVILKQDRAAQDGGDGGWSPMILGIPAGVFVVLSVVVPTWLVYLGFESHILHLRNRWAYWVVGVSLMVFAVLVRGDLAEFAHPLLGALMVSAPLLFGRGTLARRVTFVGVRSGHSAAW